MDAAAKLKELEDEERALMEEEMKYVLQLHKRLHEIKSILRIHRVSFCRQRK